jgi:hypothetical protein
MVNVGYDFSGKPNAQAIFDVIRANSSSLESFKKRVQGDVKNMQEMPGGPLPCPIDGVKWTDPETHRKYRFWWAFKDGNVRSNIVMVNNLTPA